METRNMEGKYNVITALGIEELQGFQEVSIFICPHIIDVITYPWRLRKKLTGTFFHPLKGVTVSVQAVLTLFHSRRLGTWIGRLVF